MGLNFLPPVPWPVKLIVGAVFALGWGVLLVPALYLDGGHSEAGQLASQERTHRLVRGMDDLATATDLSTMTFPPEAWAAVAVLSMVVCVTAAGFGLGVFHAAPAGRPGRPSDDAPDH